MLLLRCTARHEKHVAPLHSPSVLCVCAMGRVRGFLCPTRRSERLMLVVAHGTAAKPSFAQVPKPRLPLCFVCKPFRSLGSSPEETAGKEAKKPKHLQQQHARRDSRLSVFLQSLVHLASPCRAAFRHHWLGKQRVGAPVQIVYNVASVQEARRSLVADRCWRIHGNSFLAWL